MSAPKYLLNLNTLKNIHRIFIWTGILAVIIFLVFQRHQNTGHFNWRSKMWGDPAGYYVYLPAFFIYDFDGTKLPDNIIEKTGEGFTVDESGKIITRYTVGVAVLQAPAFLVVHAFAGILGQEKDGFSGIYHMVSALAAIMYSFLGLHFLWRFLRFYYSRFISFLTILTLFLGTNLLYYTIDATGMSHIYSFFLFSLLLYLSHLFFIEQDSRKSNWYFFFISLTSALIILIRPTNLVFVGLVFLLHVRSFDELFLRFRKVFTIKRILILVFLFVMVFLPQMLYWKYTSGSYITDSYEGYGFSNLASPQMVKFLFSTNNGLFPYNPIYILFIFSLLFMIRRKEPDGYYILFVFLGLIYLFSSWFIFSFGCGFGSRNFVEYTALFAVPVGYMFNHVKNASGKIRYTVIIITAVFVLINIKLISAYDKCFLGGDWEWKEYSYFLKSRKYTERALYFNKEVLTSEKEFSKGINVNLKNSTLVNYRRATVSLNARIFQDSSDAMVVVSIISQDSTLYWNGVALKDDYNFENRGEKQRIKADFYMPRYYTTNSVISAYVWNIGRDSLQVSRIKIKLE
jgi:hypothetical protein